jgi:hypothetical protein
MASATRSLLNSFSGGGGGSSDYFKFEDGKQSSIRLYRFDKGGTKEMCTTRLLHFGGKGVRPVDCPADGTCDRCKTVARLEGSGTKEDKDKANQMRAQIQGCFTVIDVAAPTRFWVAEVNNNVAQGIFLGCARAGGWTEVYPDRMVLQKLSSDQEREQKLLLFETAVDAGIPKVCGPNGRDILVTYNKGKGAKTWDVFVRTDGNRVLPFAEDGDVPNPEEVRRKREARFAEREGD